MAVRSQEMEDAGSRCIGRFWSILGRWVRWLNELGRFVKTFLIDDAKGLDLLCASLGTLPSQGMMMMLSL